MNDSGADASDPDDIVVTSEWDDDLRIAARTDDNGNETSYHYNSRDRLSRLENADGTQNTYAYGPSHEPLNRCDRRVVGQCFQPVARTAKMPVPLTGSWRGWPKAG